jgi:hypothetical protein
LDSLSLLLTSNDVRFSTDIAKATRASPKLLTRLCQPSKPPQFWLKIVAFTLPFKWSKALRVVLETSASNGRQNGSKSSLSTPQHDLTIGRQQRGALGPHQQTLEAGEWTILPWLSRQRYWQAMDGRTAARRLSQGHNPTRHCPLNAEPQRMEKRTIYSQFQHGRWRLCRHQIAMETSSFSDLQPHPLARHSVVHLSAVCCWIWGLERLLRSSEMPGKLMILTDERRMNGRAKHCSKGLNGWPTTSANTRLLQRTLASF